MPLGISRTRMHGAERCTPELAIVNERRKPGRLLWAEGPSVRLPDLYSHIDLLFPPKGCRRRAEGRTTSDSR